MFNIYFDTSIKRIFPTHLYSCKATVSSTSSVATANFPNKV